MILLYEILDEEWKWYKKRKSTNFFENYYFLKIILIKNMIFQCW